MPRINLTEGISVGEIGDKAGGVVYGDKNVRLFGLSALDEAKEGTIAFLKVQSLIKLRETINETRASALMVPSSLLSKSEAKTAIEVEHIKYNAIPLIAVEDPVIAIISIIPLFFRPYSLNESRHDLCWIDPTAKLGSRVNIGAFCSIGEGCIIEDDVVIYSNVTLYPGAKIGKGSVLHSGVVVREDCTVGPNSVIQNGAIIGSDGFGYTYIPNKGLTPIPQIGTVNLGSNVDVGANSCIDRATLGTTRIGPSSKIDNLVQVGHNTEIGAGTIICGQAGIAGSCKIGDRVVLGGRVGVADHLSIVEGVRVGGGGVVINDLKESGDYLGFPAVPSRQWFSHLKLFKKMLRSSSTNNENR
jgi:UDP-3-O-[3-hydroxymyristoyl] glucosamine N-acyltransferase